MSTFAEGDRVRLVGASLPSPNLRGLYGVVTTVDYDSTKVPVLVENDPVADGSPWYIRAENLEYVGVSDRRIESLLALRGVLTDTAIVDALEKIVGEK